MSLGVAIGISRMQLVRTMEALSEIRLKLSTD
jgi:hypothetical protein